MTERIGPPNQAVQFAVDQEMRLESESIIDHLKTPARFGFRTVKGFRRSFERSLVGHKRPIFLIFIAEPDSGKTHIKREFLARIKRPGGKVSMLEQSTGEEIPIYETNWGDDMSLAKVKGRIDPKKKFGDMQPSDTSAATETNEEVLDELLSENQNKRAIISCEYPATTGGWLDDVIGITGFDRGVTTLWDLARHKGKFEGKDYDAYFFAVVAYPDLREKLEKPRGRIAVAKNSQEIAKILEDSGEVVDRTKEEEIARYGQESPNIAAIKALVEQTDEFVRLMALAGKFDGNFSFDPQRFDSDKYYRADVKVEQFMKALLSRQIRVANNRCIIGFNTEFFAKRRFDTTVPIINAIWQRYPEIAQVVNK